MMSHADVKKMSQALMMSLGDVKRPCDVAAVMSQKGLMMTRLADVDVDIADVDLMQECHL